MICWRCSIDIGDADFCWLCLAQQPSSNPTPPPTPNSTNYPAGHNQCGVCGGMKLISEAVCQSCQWKPAPIRNYSVPIKFFSAGDLAQVDIFGTGPAVVSAVPPPICRYCKGTKKVIGLTQVYDCLDC